MSAGNIKVVVRCRPLNSRELGRGAKGLIRMEGNQTILDPPESNGQVSTRATEKKPMTFSFDKSYWSAGPRDDPRYASQQTLYNDLGVELLDHSFEGFNTCIFAYGQTGSGKSYSMMGYGADKGIIPLTTSELFRRVEERSAQDPKLSYIVEVSYIEIYNEKVRDLLNPKNKGNLRVREHPSLGPYVEDLSRLVVENDRQMMTLMDEGNKARTVASTNMNETSSRSHAVFTVILTQKRHDAETNMTGEKVSKISLVDLAGSERQASTGATGTRLKEGANINKSLTTLGKVIAALAQASDSVKGRKKKDDFVPYRDSVLTWLLKESLGGNSKTAMIAAISPADYEETLSTLRYADAAKRIKTHAVVNEDPNAKLIRELKEELEMLRSRVSSGGGIDESSYDPSVPLEKQIVTYKTKDGEIRKVSKLELQDQLQASEKLMESLNLTWEQKMAKTQAIHVEREKALEELGILVDKHMVGVHAPQKHPSLVNLNEDPLMSECLVYQLKPGTTTAGGVDDSKAHIKLSGENILPEHCVFTNEDGIVTVEAMPDARTFVNGKRVPPKTPIKLLNGFRVILGDFHVFRFNDPAAVRAHREKLRGSASMSEIPSHEGSPGFRPDSPGKVDEMMDWSAARREVADIAKLGDQDLDKLFDDIIKVRTQRKRPESRMDLAAELESRLISTTQTEESAENPWAGQIGTTMTSNSFGTPAVLEMDKDQATPAGVDENSEGDTALPLAQMFDQRAADAALEQQHLTKQLRTLAQELKKTRSQAAAARALETSAVEPANWSAKQLRLVQKGVSRWKLLRTYKMAEQILLRAVDLREANVIAKTMKRQVEYNFLVVDGQTANPASSLDDLTGVVEFEDVSSGPTITAGPVVVVKVVDREAQAVYTWDLDRFSTQLNKMRHVLALQERPNYSLHFRAEGTFTDSPAPSWSFIGAARVPLRLMNYHLSHTVTIPIQCRHTMEAIGSCRVTLNPLHAPASGATTPGTVSLPMTNQLVPGTKLSFSIVIDTVKGLSAGDFASVHAQTRLSSLVGSDIAADDIFASLPVDLDKSSVAHLSLRRNVSVIVTPDLISHLETGHGTIEFFAKVRPEYLDRLERFDRNREVLAAGSGSSTPSRADKGDSRPMMRRCETDFIASEHHDILASVCIKELASDGAYEPAEVFDNIVHLHQGVQRQIHLTLSHSSGKALPWVKVSHFSSGDIRVKTNTGIIGASRPDVELRGVQQEVTFDTDGTSRLDIYGVWDTASHHCIHLDRKTASESKVLVKLTWLVEVSSLDEPAVFHLDLPIRILNRDTRRSSLMALFTAPKIFKAYTAVFSVDLGPPLASTAGDLWRLDTGKKHVIGEEILGDWKPRSVSLLQDWERLRRTDRTLAEVQLTKVVLNLVGDGSQEVMSEERRAEVIKLCVASWMKALEHRVKVDLGKRSEEEESLLKKLRTVVPDLEPKLVPTVRLVNRVDKIIKQGPMMFLRDPQANEWEKRYFVLRRPFLHVHPTASEREVQVINLTKATVVPSPDVELLLGKRFAFTVFTSTNSYVLQAGSAKEMGEWIGVIATTSEG